MCTRTKTSFGCGHTHKTTNQCRYSDCSGLERYHIAKPGDCRGCRSGGANVTRGREGRGRYAREIRRERTDSVSSAEASPDSRDVSGGASPWAPQRDMGKSWGSRHRKKADDAWLDEHEDRIHGLQQSLEKCSVSESRSRSQRPRSYKADQDYDYYGQVDGHDRLYQEMPTKKHRDVLRQVDDGLYHRSHSDAIERYGERHHSHNSLPDSMSSYHSSPMMNTYNRSRTLPEPRPDYDYDYYSPSKRQGRRRDRDVPKPESYSFYRPQESELQPTMIMDDFVSSSPVDYKTFDLALPETRHDYTRNPVYRYAH